MANTHNFLEQELIEAIDAFCAEHSMGTTVFGLKAVNDPTFMKTLKDGREVRRKTRQRVLGFIEGFDGPSK